RGAVTPELGAGEDGPLRSSEERWGGCSSNARSRHAVRRHCPYLPSTISVAFLTPQPDACAEQSGGAPRTPGDVVSAGVLFASFLEPFAESRSIPALPARDLPRRG